MQLRNCPDDVDSAVDFRWQPGLTVDYAERGSIYIVAENLTDDRLVIEYEVAAAMQGSSRSIGIPTPEQSLEAHRARFHRFNLQFGAEFKVLEAGTVHVGVRARLVAPVQTAFVEVSSVDVKLQIDEDGRIYRIVYEAVDGEPV